MSKHCSNESRIMNTPTNDAIGGDKLQPMREDMCSIIEQRELRLHRVDFLPNRFHADQLR